VILRRQLVLALVAIAAALGTVWAFGSGHSAAAPARTPRTGVVVIETRLVGGGGAAGTGIVLTSSGEVLTNNHVIRGATSVNAITGDGHSYTARVLGYSVGKDIAVLQLQNAHGLQTALVGRSATVKQGSAVTAVGNAGGSGTLTTVTGRVTDLGRVITVSDESGNTAQLTDMIETSAPLQPGDSGGPLLLGGRVVGVDAAAQRGFQLGEGADGFAIPVDTAVSIAKQVVSGRRSLAVHVGPTAFLGVALAPGAADSGGASVYQVVSGSPADKAGLQPGDVITRIGSRTVVSRSTVQNALLQARPGQTLRLTWSDQSGTSHSATVRPVSGPPQ